MFRAVFLFIFCLAQAEELTPPSSTPSVSSTEASWKDQYTVGPGDTFRIDIYGKSTETQRTVTIEPDGTLTYLQVQNIPIEGLTIDAMREMLEQALGQFYKLAKVNLQPVQLKSKRFFILGKVKNNGAIMLDHPTTIIEAIGLAKGITAGMTETSATGLADLSRAFLVRHGKRVKVDFEKLFLEGDLSQNIELEPNDYLYFPTLQEWEVFILGAVRAPSRVYRLQNKTVLSAIIASGDFHPDAFRDRVLVIRGGLNHPETFVVDCNDILKGRAVDFQLQSKDIVYVSTRPWRIVEELLDTAVSAFVSSAVNGWTGSNIEIGTEAVIPQL